MQKHEKYTAFNYCTEHNTKSGSWSLENLCQAEVRGVCVYMSMFIISAGGMVSRKYI